MFGTLSSLVNLSKQNRVAPEDIPPATPVQLPRYQPFAQNDAEVDFQDALSNLLKTTGRSTAVLGSLGLSAIGFDLKLDVGVTEVIPDPRLVPDFAQWDRLAPEEAEAANEASRNFLSNGNLSPGCQVYLERRRELSHKNQEAFRTVRRIPPPRGKQNARLGNAYEFYRCLELFTTYWDDPTQPPPTLPPSPEMSPVESTQSPCGGGHQITTTDGGTAGMKDQDPQQGLVVRTADGSAMPPEFRLNLATAFVKLVSYDFGCNVSMSRVEPRLHLSSPKGHPRPRKSYTASNCQFIFQSPTTREAARAGLVHGPLAALSARPTINFTAPSVEAAQSLDLAREVLAALIAAQHRAREGKTETRFGEGQWWACKPRWGGGPGGPIGREIEREAGKDAGKDTGKDTGKDAHKDDLGIDDLPVVRFVKKARKTMSMYDNYRMVRPPSYAWDKKARYEAIGKKKGADHDDIFVISSLFHHVSILRIRVPSRLLDILDGSQDPHVSRRSWGKVQGWRSPWFDLFDTEQRLTAMRFLWAVMAYQMRIDADDAEMKDV